MRSSRRLTQHSGAEYRRNGWWSGPALAEVVDSIAQRDGGRLAVVDERSRHTYGELWRDAGRFAGHLRDVGVGPGDVVSVQLPNRYEAVVAAVGSHAHGAVVNPLLPSYRAHELEYILGKAGTKVFVVPDEHRGFDHVVMALELRERLPGLELVVVGGGGDPDPVRFDDVIGDQINGAPIGGPANVAADIAAVTEVIFTSGTEARPKPVMHTEETVNFSLRNAARLLGLTEHDVVFIPSPVGHSTGFNACMRLGLLHGLPLVLLDRWDASIAARLIQEERCSYTLAATTFLNDLVEVAERDGSTLPTMRVFGCGGAPVPASLVRRARAVGVEVLRIYGSTETMLVSWNRPESPTTSKEDTDGLVLDDVSVEIRDVAGQALPTGEIGEITVSGPNLFVGYYDSPDQTSAAFDEDDVWFATGDLGSLDGAGYLTIHGRKKEIIIRGGLNIAPREIEELLQEIPGVAAAAVLGLPDERLGEITCACIVPAGPDGDAITADGVLTYLRGRDLAVYKLPQRVLLIDDLPRTASGKVAKHILLDQITSGRGSS